MHYLTELTLATTVQSVELRAESLANIATALRFKTAAPVFTPGCHSTAFAPRKRVTAAQKWSGSMHTSS
jgi:hypothetical protein